MATIELDGKALTQWDTDRWVVLKLAENESVNEVHFANSLCGEALVVAVESNKAPIPNVFLQSSRKLKVWLVAYTDNGERAVDVATVFNVTERPKPVDYVYTETEVRSYEALEERIKELERNSFMGLTDKVTGKAYGLSVIDGKLTMEEVV